MPEELPVPGVVLKVGLQLLRVENFLFDFFQPGLAYSHL